MRLFVAADLPEDLRAALPCVGAREKLHVTLVFIGERDAAPSLAPAPPVAPLRVTGPLRLGRGRVFAAGLDDPTGEWTAYQAAVADAVGVVETRPWRPHITLARRRPPDPFAVAPGEFVPPAVTLYRSAGGRYEPLARLPALT